MDLNKRTFTLRIDDETLERLRLIAEKDRRSTNSLILSIIDDYLENYNKGDFA